MSIFSLFALLPTGVARSGGTEKAPPRRSSPPSPLRRHAPARTETSIVVPTYMVCIDGRVCRPYAGGILIHLRFGQNTAHAHLFFHLSLNNAMDTLCVETVVSTCLARDCPPAVCLARC